MADKSRNEKQRLKTANRIVRGGVNFLSGTMAPAKSDPDAMDIESLAKAFEHYAKRGVEKVVVQPKYMGSRCQVYSFKDREKCFAVSRKGFVINHVDISNVLEDRWRFWHEQDAGLELVIEDGELMPWAALGEKLIDKSCC